MRNHHPSFIQMREEFRLKYIQHRNASNKSYESSKAFWEMATDPSNEQIEQFYDTVVENLAKEQAFKSVLDYMDQNPVYIQNPFTKAEDFLR